MPFETCSKCRESVFVYPGSPRHVCKPAWQFRIPDTMDRWDTVHAGTREYAAEKVAERYDQGSDGMSIASTDGETALLVEVRRDERDRVTRYKVTGSMNPHYAAEEVDEDDDD